MKHYTICKQCGNLGRHYAQKELEEHFRKLHGAGTLHLFDEYFLEVEM